MPDARKPLIPLLFLGLLAAITTHAAWQIHADDRGSLEVGKAADFGIADGNPWGSDPEGWADIAFQATYVDGVEAWHA